MLSIKFTAKVRSQSKLQITLAFPRQHLIHTHTHKSIYYNTRIHYRHNVMASNAKRCATFADRVTKRLTAWLVHFRVKLLACVWSWINVRFESGTVWCSFLVDLKMNMLLYAVVWPPLASSDCIPSIDIG